MTLTKTWAVSRWRREREGGRKGIREGGREGERRREEGKELRTGSQSWSVKKSLEKDWTCGYRDRGFYFR